MRCLSRWPYHIAAPLSFVVMIACGFAPPSSAQGISGPSNSQPWEPFQLRDDARHAKRWQEGEALWNDVDRLLADVNGKISAGKLGSLNPRTIGDIRAKQRTVMKIGRELEAMGETAGVEFQHRALWAGDQLRRITDSLRKSPAFLRKLDSEVKSLRAKAARYRKLLDNVEDHVKRENWETADVVMQRMMLDLESRAIWINGSLRQKILKKFDAVRGKVEVGLYTDLRRRVGRTLGDRFNAEAPDLDKYARRVDEKIKSIEADGSAELTSGRRVDGPQLIGEINTLWRRMQVRTLRLKALNWVRARSDPKARPAQSTLEKQYEQFDRTVRGAMVRLIDADTARADADEAARLYPRYLQAVAPLLARGDDAAWSRSLSKALDALLAKSPALAENVESYRRATDDVLRWRRRAAASQTAQRQAGAPALDRLAQAAFLPDAPRDAPGLIGSVGALPTLRGRAAATVNAVSERMIGQDVHRGPMTGSGAGDARRYTSWLERRTLTHVTRRVDLDSAVARLKRDLLVDNGAAPLSVEAAVAVFKAEQGDLAAAGGKIETVELLSLVNFVAAIEAEEPFLLRPGQLPRDVRDSGQPMHALVVRFSLKPSWVQNEYFFVELD